MAKIDVSRVEILVEKLNTRVGFNQIETDLVIKNLKSYCYITRSIPIYRNNYVDVILDLSNSNVYMELREVSIIVDFMMLRRLNLIYELTDEFNDGVY